MTIRAAIFIDDMTLALEYETHRVFPKIIDSLPNEALRGGFELGISDGEISEFIMEKYNELDCDYILTDAGINARLFGGALLVMFVDDGQGLDMPLDPKKAHRLIELRMYPRTEAIPDYGSAYSFDAKQPWKTGKPEFYDIMTDTGGQFRVHESRCLIFANGKLKSQSMYQQYKFWGIPEYLRLKQPLDNYSLAYDMSPKMVERSAVPIYKTNLERIMAEDGTGAKEKKLRKIVRRLSRSLRFDRVAAIDKNEEFSYTNASFSGVKDALQAAKDDLASAARMPQTKLFGSSPGGLNATGESDAENWHSEVEAYQALNLKKPIMTIIDLIIREGIFKGKIKEYPEINFAFKPLEVLSELEEAQLELEKMKVSKQKADIAALYCELGALDPSEVRKGLKEDNEYDIEDLVHEEVNKPSFLAKFLDELKTKSLQKDHEHVIIRRDGAKEEWKTINGAPVLFVDGVPQGDIGRKIAKSYYANELKGVKIRDGGVISGVSRHAAERACERGWSTNDIEDVLQNYNSSYPGNTPNSTFYALGLRKVLVSGNGNIMSMYQGG